MIAPNTTCRPSGEMTGGVFPGITASSGRRRPRTARRQMGAFVCTQVPDNDNTGARQAPAASTAATHPGETRGRLAPGRRWRRRPVRVHAVGQTTTTPRAQTPRSRRRLKACARRLLETPIDDALERRRDVALGRRRDRPDPLSRIAVDRVGGVCAVEGTASSEQFVEQQGQRRRCGAVIRLLARAPAPATCSPPCPSRGPAPVSGLGDKVCTQDARRPSGRPAWQGRSRESSRVRRS